MMQKILSRLSRPSSTIVGGIALAVSAVFKFAPTGLDLPAYLDPIWITVVCNGLPIAVKSFRRLIFEHQIKAGLLITLAMGASIAIGERFAAGEVVFIMALGGLLEDLTVARARRGLDALVRLAPTQASRLLPDGRIQRMTAAEIVPHDTLRVLPGEVFPVDGKILSGETSVDESVMTGESLPVDKAPGSTVLCGTLNRFGAVDVSATETGTDTSLQKMIRLAREAETKKAPTEGAADKWAAILVPTALLIAIVTGFVTGRLTPAVTVLVVFCPCSLVLATPISIMAAIGQAAKRGVLIKSGAALETMGRVTCLAFDKTGTLTAGQLRVSDTVPADTFTAEELLAAAAAVESRSEHPIARAIVRATETRAIPETKVTDFISAPGRGARAQSDEREIRCGTAAFLAEAGITPPPDVTARLACLQEEGKATLLVARDKVCLGVIALSDTVRPKAAAVLSALHAEGLETALLTGDNVRAAAALARQLNFTRVKAGLLPEGKVAALRTLQQDGKCVAMVGDGVNDAAAIKTANVGLAMGTAGSDVAIDAADIALMGDNLENVPYTHRLAVETLRTIHFNISLSMIVNTIAVTCGILGLLTPVSGAIVHNVGSLLVVLNAARLYDRKI